MIRPFLLLFFLMFWSLHGFTQSAENNERGIRPAWSPQGNGFAFLSNKTGNYQLYFRDLETSEVRQLTKQGDRPLSQFKWSPNGEKLLFLSGEHLMVINADGTGLFEVYQKQTNPFFFGWHPNGKAITISCSFFEGTVNICSKDLDQEATERLTKGTKIDRNFNWSKTGEQLVYGSNADGGFDIYLWDASTSTSKKLTDFPNNAIDPTFIPDDKTVLLMHDRNGDNKNFDVHLLNLEDGASKQLTTWNGYNLPLAILDESELLVSSNGNGTWEIYRINLKDEINQNIGDGIAFSVSPDGSQVLVQSNTKGFNEIILINLKEKKAP